MRLNRVRCGVSVRAGEVRVVVGYNGVGLEGNWGGRGTYE